MAQEEHKEEAQETKREGTREALAATHDEEAEACLSRRVGVCPEGSAMQEGQAKVPQADSPVDEMRMLQHARAGGTTPRPSSFVRREGLSRQHRVCVRRLSRFNTPVDAECSRQ